MENILIIDDEIQNIQHVAYLLDKFGYAPFALTEPAYLFDMLQNNTFDLILMDFNMPEKNGIVLLKQLKQHPLFKQIPVIMFTGERNKDIHAECFELGAIDFINKPIEEVILKARLESAIKIQRYLHQMKTFVGIVSHDLRAPIDHLSHYCNQLTKKPFLIHSCLDGMTKTAHRAVNLIHNLLDLSAMESGKINMNFRKCHFYTIAKRSLEEVNLLAENKKIKLINHSSIDDPPIKADGARIFQVITNLLTNAIKFTSRSGQVILETKVQKKGLLIQVIDTGEGIAPETIPKLFNKYAKVSTEGTSGEVGTGYGLPLCQEIILEHNSNINVNSQRGKGSNFSFLLSLWEK